MCGQGVLLFSSLFLSSFVDFCCFNFVSTFSTVILCMLIFPLVYQKDEISVRYNIFTNPISHFRNEWRTGNEFLELI